MPNRSALGLIETRGLVSAIEAADAAVKAAEVRITSVEVTVPAMVTIKLEGDLGAVQAAVSAGAVAASRIGELVAAHVIPRPDDELDKILPDTPFVNPADPTHSSNGQSMRIPADERLEDLTVIELRRLAREQKGFPLAGREISHANKHELISHLRAWRDRAPEGEAGPAPDQD